MRVAVALSPGPVIPAEAIVLEPVDIAAAPEPPQGAAPPAAAGDLSLRAAERRHIRWVLEQTGGNKRRAARALGLARSTLDRKLGAWD